MSDNLDLFVGSTFPFHRIGESRINGDMRKRKKRLRMKLEKLDQIRFAPVIKLATRYLQRRMDDSFLRGIYAGTRANAPREAGAVAPSLHADVGPGE